MNVVKFCLLPVLVLIVLAAGGIYFWSGSLPAEWGSQASTTIDAPAAEIHPFVADLREWPRWDESYRESQETTIRFENDGRRAVIDASGSDASDDASGGMVSEIVEHDPASGVTVRTSVDGTELWTTEITYEVVADGTVVTYSFGGNAEGRAEKISGWMIQTGLGEYTPLSLASLGELVESGAHAEHGDSPDAGGSDASGEPDPSDQ